MYKICCFLMYKLIVCIFIYMLCKFIFIKYMFIYSILMLILYGMYSVRIVLVLIMNIKLF